MASVDVRTAAGDEVGSVTLDPAVFGVTPNVAVMHQVVTAQLAAARSGTQSTLTRAEVSGGGRKPWRQKGSGRARQGSTRAPHWTGGGVALGPKPRSYRQRTPKKMVQLALRSALSDRAAEGRVAVVEAWAFDSPRTRQARAALGALGLAGKVLVVLGPDEDTAARSFRNLPDVHVLASSELNPYDVLCSDWVVFTRATLPGSADTAADAGARPEVAPAGSGDDSAHGTATAPGGLAEAPAAGPPEGEPGVPLAERDWDAPLRGGDGS
ncbi:MAG: 50S ribosomal protein L4 [Acidimicrobiales bacterium]